MDKFLEAAEKLSKGMIGHDFVYCLEENVFYHYQDNYWKRMAEMEIMRIIIENAYGQDKSIMNITKQSYAKRKEILENLKLYSFKRLEVFNASNRLNFDAGEFEPETGKIYEHKKENYSTIRMPYPLDISKECPLWLKTLDEIFEGDQKKIDTLQEYFGYCLTRDTSQIMSLLLIGQSKTGKSTILHTLRYMIGDDNCSNVAMKNMGNGQFTARLMNKLVNIDADVSENAKEFEYEFKLITSGEPINCNEKYVATFDFTPYCKIVMGANRFPRISDHSSAFYNRLLSIPCTRIFAPDEQNRALKKELTKELMGVFNWSVKGLKRLNERGRFEENDFVADLRKELRMESNPIEIFFEENIATDVSGNCEIAKEDLYHKYKSWCVENGNSPMANNKFGGMVYDKYSKFTPKNTMSHKLMKRVWRNLRYINAVIQQQQDVGWKD